MKSQITFSIFPTSRLLLPFLVIANLILVAQSPENTPIRVAFYNLENLFHPDDDSLTLDEEFTPEGGRYWSYYRYHKKVNLMAKAIISIGEWDAPTIVGMEEAENRQVLEDLLASSVLKKIPYRLVHYESPDRRGIDVAMIYRLDQFTLLYSKNIRLRLPDQPDYRTRDILYVKGIAAHHDTLHLFVCHWPSRYGGQAISEPKRMAAAKLLREQADSLYEVHKSPNIIIGGDFNDEPENKSLQYLCKPDEQNQSATALVNLMANKDPAQGSHRHHGIWTYLDQIIVSAHLTNNEKPRIHLTEAVVHRPAFLLEEDRKYPGMKPYRHFLGLRYHGGFSDHLPVYIDLHLTSINYSR